MKNNTKICALILARGGSKRLPKKNIKDFSGKPLISWTIESALKAQRFDRIFCYSDDDQILSTAIRSGAEVPFKRPELISGDNISSIETIKYFLNELRINDLYYPDYIVLLQPTSPLRTEKHIVSALNEAMKKNFDLMVSVKKNKTLFKNIRYIADGKLKNLKSELENRTEISLKDYELYSANGAIYIFNVKALDKNLPIESYDTIPFVMKEIESMDIDTKEQFIISEQIFKINHE